MSTKRTLSQTRHPTPRLTANWSRLDHRQHSVGSEPTGLIAMLFMVPGPVEQNQSIQQTSFELVQLRGLNSVNTANALD